MSGSGWAFRHGITHKGETELLQSNCAKIQVQLVG